jgi:uncharacterized protein YheU (UPF0270 family)
MSFRICLGAIFLVSGLLTGCDGGSGSTTNSNTATDTDTTNDNSWTCPPNLTDGISVAGENALFPNVVMDNSGNKIVLWIQSDGTNDRIYMSSYRNDSWTHPTDLATDAIGVAGQSVIPSPESVGMAMDDSGNAIIVWRQQDGLNTRIYMSEYRNGSWTHPTDLASDAISIAGYDTGRPMVAMDNNGNAIIAWRQSDGSNEQIYMSNYRNGSWTHPTNLVTDAISVAGLDAAVPRVAMDNNGNAIIVWQQLDDSANMQIYKSEYRNGGWTHPTNLATDTISVAGENAVAPRVAMDNNGNAIIVWGHTVDADWLLYKSEYRNGGWTNPADLAANAIDVGLFTDFPTLAMDDNGNAIIVWSEKEPTPTVFSQVYKLEYRNDSWNSAADAVSIAGQGYPNYPQVAMDNNGNAIITWKQWGDLDFQIYKSEYRDAGWKHPTSLAADAISVDGQSADFPGVAMNDDGNSIIIWSQWDGSAWRIYKSEYL